MEHVFHGLCMCCIKALTTANMLNFNNNITELVTSIKINHLQKLPTSINGPNRSCQFAAGSPTDSVDSQSFRTLSTRPISVLVAERSTLTLLFRLLLQCTGDIEMNPGPDSTPTPTSCLRLMQWNANGISCKITELLTFLQNNNVNMAVIQKTKLSNWTKPLKTSGWAAVLLDRHKNIGGVLLTSIKDTIPFVDNTTALPQSADPHLEQQGISIAMPNRQQLLIHNIYIPPRSSFSARHNASTAHLLSNTKCRLLLGILMHMTPDGVRTQTKTKEANS